MRDFTLGNLFHDSTKMLDNLIKILKENHWTVYNGNSFHEYQWPDIVLSERKIKISEGEWDTDYLGAYFLTPLAIGEMECLNKCNEKYESIEDEGYVVLYENTILECASSIKLDNITLEQVIIGLTTIVLIHEFAHWIILDVTMEGVEKFDKANFNANYEKNPDFKNFHERLAQYFTYFMIQNNNNLKNIFLHLNEGQSQPYKRWMELNNSSKNDISDNDFTLMLKTILFSRELIIKHKINTQSFELLKFLFVDIMKEIEFGEKDYSYEEVIKMLNNIEMAKKMTRYKNGELDKLIGVFNKEIQNELRGRITGHKYGL